MKETYSEYRERTIYGQETSTRYAARKLKHRGEFDLVDKALVHIPKGHRVLDIPCGGGRFSVHLSQQGYQMSSADRSESMIEITSTAMRDAGFEPSASQQDIEQLTFGDRSFDSVFCFRLFHHFPDKSIRERAVAELCRIADQYVVMSYFNSRCVNMVRRRVRDRLKGKLYKKYGTPLYEVRGYFQEHGFHFIEDFPERRGLRPLHIAVFRRGD